MEFTMKAATRLAILTLLLSAMIGGCAVSENAFYKDDQVVAEPLLVGKWLPDKDNPNDRAVAVREGDRRGHYLAEDAFYGQTLELVLFRMGDTPARQ